MHFLNDIQWLSYVRFLQLVRFRIFNNLYRLLNYGYQHVIILLGEIVNDIKYYVYAHFTNDTHECFYVGCGSGDRFKQTDNRNEIWKHIVNKHGHYSVILVKGFTSRPDALRLEGLLQILIQPRACISTSIGHEYKHNSNKYKPVINCRGEVYMNLQEAANIFNIENPQKIRQCCRGKINCVGKYPDGDKVKWQYYTK